MQFTTWTSTRRKSRGLANPSARTTVNHEVQPAEHDAMTTKELRIVRKTITFVFIGALTFANVERLLTGGGTGLILFTCALSLVGVGFIVAEIRRGDFRII